MAAAQLLNAASMPSQSGLRPHKEEACGAEGTVDGEAVGGRGGRAEPGTGGAQGQAGSQEREREGARERGSEGQKLPCGEATERER